MLTSGFYWVKRAPSSGGEWIIAEFSSEFGCFHECGLEDYFEADAYAQIGPRIEPPTGAEAKGVIRVFDGTQETIIGADLWARVMQKLYSKGEINATRRQG